MPDDPFSPADERLPDLPGLPPDLSLDGLAGLYRFLDARDLRAESRCTALYIDPAEPEEDHPARVVPFEIGDFDPAIEAAPIDDEGRMVAKSGEVLTASGHRLHAVLILERPADFQHWGAIFVVPVFEPGASRNPELISESSEDFAELVARLKRWAPYTDLEIYPYAYRYYDASAYTLDPHVDEGTGWSKNGGRVMDGVVRKTTSEEGSR